MPFPYNFTFDFDPKKAVMIVIKTLRSYIKTIINNKTLIQTSITVKPYIKTTIRIEEEI